MGKLLNVSGIRYHCWPGQYSGSYVHVCQLAHLRLENYLQALWCTQKRLHRVTRGWNAGLDSADYFWGISRHTVRQPVDVAGAEGRVALQSEHAHLFLYDSRSCRNIPKPLQFTPPRMGGGERGRWLESCALALSCCSRGRNSKKLITLFDRVY